MKWRKNKEIKKQRLDDHQQLTGKIRLESLLKLRRALQYDLNAIRPSAWMIPIIENRLNGRYHAILFRLKALGNFHRPRNRVILRLDVQKRLAFEFGIHGGRVIGSRATEGDRDEIFGSFDVRHAFDVRECDLTRGGLGAVCHDEGRGY